MVAPAIFGITNDALNLAVKLLLLFLAAVWLALVFWTYADARRRVADPMLVMCAGFAAAFFPFVGSIVYAIVRPPEYLDDARERDLEIAAAEAKLLQVQESTCPHCGHDIEKTFLRCPHCTRRLKEPCGNCARPLDPRWQICPYCEAEVPQAAAPQQQAQPRRRGRRDGSSERSAPARQTAAAREPAPRERQRPGREGREPGVEPSADASRGGRGPRAEDGQPGREGRGSRAARAEGPPRNEAGSQPTREARAPRTESGAREGRASRDDAAFRPVRDSFEEARPARVLRDSPQRGSAPPDPSTRAPAPPDPSTRVNDATAEQPARRPRPSADPA
ncbi:MAG: hypothetical protein QOE06_2319 [Thermoleophilaceae bacterium]|nr:hypothetical protein [Thermoleophilaceae bacterium]